MRHLSRFALLSLLLAACPTDEGDDSAGPADTADSGVPDPDGDPKTVPLNGMCPLETRWGSFVVEAYEDYSIVDGQIANGVVPVTILEEVEAEGDCKLLKRNNPYCNPTCEPGETCDFDGSCIPYPENQDLGTVTVAGLEESVSMEPRAPSFDYFDTSLPHPAFAPWSLIQLVTQGGAFAPITLHGVGGYPLTSSGTSWVIKKEEDLAIVWDAPPEEVRTTLALTLNIDQHGLSPVNLVCSFSDDGEAVIPASVTDALLSYGVSGYPSGKIERRTEDKAQLDEGCVDFTVGFELSMNVSVSGHTPCTSDDDCPDGQVCNLPIQTCESAT